MRVEGGSVSWRRVKDVTCGWVSGATVTKGEGIFSGSYPDSILVTNTLSSAASGLVLNFNTDCRPLGSRGYNLDWDVWLCNFSELDTVATQIEYEQCSYTFRYYFGTIGDSQWLLFYNSFDDSIRALLNLGVPSTSWAISMGSQVGSIGKLEGFGNMAIFKLAFLTASEDPADDIYAYGAPGGIGTALALGSTLRAYFRGIHPKIYKWGKADGIRPDSIYIMTPSGPIKVKL